ncbi:MAG: ATP-binding cassette domain-containing protein [Myxococcota bacterium]
MNTCVDLQHITLLTPGSQFAILRDLSLQLQQGDFAVLLGANGCGKSSLLKVLAGLRQPHSGRICLQGHVLNRQRLQSVAASVRILSQDPDLATFRTLTVWENCCLAQWRGSDSNQQKLRTDRPFFADYLQDFHPQLPTKLDELVENLSGGQRQSLALGMSLLHLPALLLLDEHTSALDPAAADRMMQLTTQHITQLNVTTIMATHRIEDALRYGNHLLFMRDGQLQHHVCGQRKHSLTKQDVIAWYE